MINCFVLSCLLFYFFNAYIYMHNIYITCSKSTNLPLPLSTLSRSVHRHLKYRCTIDAFIAKIYGFRDKIDYYRQSGSKWWLNKIRVPSIAINARDDPFIEESSLPNDSDLVIGSVDENSKTRSNEQLLAPVKLIYTNRGGHCGYLSSLWSSRSVPSWGWLAEELSRALKHIHENDK